MRTVPSWRRFPGDRQINCRYIVAPKNTAFYGSNRLHVSEYLCYVWQWHLLEQCGFTAEIPLYTTLRGAVQTRTVCGKLHMYARYFGLLDYVSIQRDADTKHWRSPLTVVAREQERSSGATNKTKPVPHENGKKYLHTLRTVSRVEYYRVLDNNDPRTICERSSSSRTMRSRYTMPHTHKHKMAPTRPHHKKNESFDCPRALQCCLRRRPCGYTDNPNLTPTRPFPAPTVGLRR